MSKLFLRLMLVAGVGMTAAACQGDGYGAPSGYYQPAQGYYQPAPAYYQPAPAYYAPAPITVWLCAACAELQPDGRPSLYHGGRDEPRPAGVP